MVKRGYCNKVASISIWRILYFLCFYYHHQPSVLGSFNRNKPFTPASVIKLLFRKQTPKLTLPPKFDSTFNFLAIDYITQMSVITFITWFKDSLDVDKYIICKALKDPEECCIFHFLWKKCTNYLCHLNDHEDKMKLTCFKKYSHIDEKWQIPWFSWLLKIIGD